MLVSAPVNADPRGNDAVEAVRDLRATTVPRRAGRLTGPEALVTGLSAEQADYSDLIGFWLPIVIAFVLLATLVLLTVVFRSLVAALVGIALNLLSVGAAFGLLVLVFQHGVGAGLLGFTQVDAVEAWVPLFTFSVLFGLSMDYHVFILSRIREALPRDGLHRGGRRARDRIHRPADHGRRADHRRRLHGLRDRRPRHVPADGLRRGRGAADRRDADPHGAAAGGDDPARRAQLVPASPAAVAGRELQVEGLKPQ